MPLLRMFVAQTFAGVREMFLRKGFQVTIFVDRPSTNPRVGLLKTAFVENHEDQAFISLLPPERAHRGGVPPNAKTLVKTRAPQIQAIVRSELTILSEGP